LQNSQRATDGSIHPSEGIEGQVRLFGHFYSVEVAPTKVVDCRSVLEIVEKAKAPEELSALSNRKPDAIFIKDILSSTGNVL
jgi:hypothetical protein